MAKDVLMLLAVGVLGLAIVFAAPDFSLFTPKSAFMKDLVGIVSLLGRGALVAMSAFSFYLAIRLLTGRL
jgi:hypothetical protein